MTAIELVFLGSARITIANSILAVSRRQPLVLLAYLAMAEAAVTRDTLAFLFWADVPHDIARQRLRRTLGQLREMLQRAKVPDLVHIQGERIGFAHDRCTIDVHEFQQLASGGTDTLAATIDRCEAAIARYGGAFLAEISLDDSPELDHWLRQVRDRLEQLHLHCLGTLADRYADTGETTRAIAAAERLLTIDPLREDTHRLLIRLYALTGQRALALRQYEKCASILATELGVEPLAETRSLYEALRRDTRGVVATTRSTGPKWPIRPSLAAPCLGRDQEIASLVALLDQGLRGKPALACVSGPAGIGKTRLIQEAVRAFAYPVWLSVGQPAGQNVPFGAVLPALRGALAPGAPLPKLDDLWLAEVSRVLPEVRLARPDLRPPASLPPDQAQARLFEGLIRLVAALARRTEGAILVFDNLENADTISLAWLANLLRDADDMTLGIVVAFRSPPHQSILHQWLDHLTRLGARGDIALTPISIDTTTDLVGRLGFAAPALSERLWTETGGNPFFLLETLRLIADRDQVLTDRTAPLPLPATVQEVILARLRTLDQLSRQIVDAAAILAPSFDVETVRTVGGRDEMETALALDALVAAQLLVEVGTSYRFAHAQIADVVYAGVGGARRRILHRRAAESLEHHPAVSAAVLAQHLERAGQATAAAAAWLAAAGQAASVFAAEEALSSLARGLALVDDPAQRCELLALREDLFEHLGRRSEQAAALDELARLATGLGPQQQALAYFRRGRYLAALGSWEESEAALRQVVAIGGEVTAEARLLLARTLTEQQRWDEATAIGLRTLQEANDTRVQGRALHTLAQIARTREDRVALETYLRQALASTPEADPLRARLLLDLGEVLFRQGRHDLALTIATEALQLAQEQASRATEALAHNQIGNCLTRLNRNMEALAAFRRAAQAHRMIENRAGQAAAIGNLGVLAMRMGLLEESLVSMAEAYDLFDTLGNVPGLCVAANNLGTALIWLDRSAEAIPHLQGALVRAIAADLPIREAATRCNLGAALLDLGRLGEGVALMERGVAMRRDLRYGDLCIDHACLAVAYLRVGRVAAADALSAQALAELAQNDSGVGHPQRVPFARAQVLRALAHNLEAEDALAQAWGQFEQYSANLTTAAERERYRTAFVFNRDLQAARLDRWPDPPRLV